jgi:hypothetical protein
MIQTHKAHFKNIPRNLHHYFDIKLFKINDEKFIKYFSNIHYDVYNNHAKSQTKIHLKYGETKMTNCIMG